MVEWTLITACACHDIHISFTWSLRRDVDFTCDCYIGVEWVRNSFNKC